MPVLLPPVLPTTLPPADEVVMLTLDAAALLVPPELGAVVLAACVLPERDSDGAPPPVALPAWLPVWDGLGPGLGATRKRAEAGWTPAAEPPVEPGDGPAATEAAAAMYAAVVLVEPGEDIRPRGSGEAVWGGRMQRGLRGKRQKGVQCARKGR